MFQPMLQGVLFNRTTRLPHSHWYYRWHRTKGQHCCGRQLSNYPEEPHHRHLCVFYWIRSSRILSVLWSLQTIDCSTKCKLEVQKQFHLGDLLSPEFGCHHCLRSEYPWSRRVKVPANRVGSRLFIDEVRAESYREILQHHLWGSLIKVERLKRW